METPHVVAKPIRPQRNGKAGKESNRSMWATICYYYPQYTLESASRLSVRDIRLLLNTARRQEAIKMLQLTQIVAAPHTKKGKGVKDLTKHYQEESER